MLVAHIQVLAFTSSSIYSKGKSQTLQWPTTLLIFGFPQGKLDWQRQVVSGMKYLCDQPAQNISATANMPLCLLIYIPVHTIRTSATHLPYMDLLT